MKHYNTSRRSFMKAVLAAGAFPYVGACASARCPDGKVRLACVGIGQQAWNDIQQFAATGIVEIAALCDTDLDGRQCVAALKKYPNVPRFRDFRKMLDAMDGKIDAV
ncbi:MAG: gfo/Idh/MocA family oxidoreductase, partial [Kiritimatiellia bacterium]